MPQGATKRPGLERSGSGLVVQERLGWESLQPLYLLATLWVGVVVGPLRATRRRLGQELQGPQPRQVGMSRTEPVVAP